MYPWILTGYVIRFASITLQIKKAFGNVARREGISRVIANI